MRRRTAVFGLLILLAACTKSTSQGVFSGSSAEVRELVLLTGEGSVNATVLRANLDAALKALNLPSDYQLIDSTTLANTDVRRGYPTPTLLFRNRDVFGVSGSPDSAPT